MTGPRVYRHELVRIAVTVLRTNPENVGKMELAKARVAHDMYQNGATVKAIRERLNIPT